MLNKYLWNELLNASHHFYQNTILLVAHNKGNPDIVLLQQSDLKPSMEISKMTHILTRWRLGSRNHTAKNGHMLERTGNLLYYSSHNVGLFQLKVNKYSILTTLMTLINLPKLVSIFPYLLIVILFQYSSMTNPVQCRT